VEETIKRLGKVLGASSMEAAGHDARFSVEDDSGFKLRVSIEGASQRFMATLTDAGGKTRCTVDLAPVTEAFEEPNFEGRVTLRVGHQLVHLDSLPTVGIEVESIEPEHRAESQRLRAMSKESL
jgi:hypothetical protein